MTGIFCMRNRMTGHQLAGKAVNGYVMTLLFSAVLVEKLRQAEPLLELNLILGHDALPVGGPRLKCSPLSANKLSHEGNQEVFYRGD